MSAVSNFPKNINPAALRAGLVVQPKPTVECNEYGLQQATLQFITLNENYPRLVPARATPCDQFVPGDSITKAVLKQLSFMGRQTTRYIRGGASPGTALIELLCQGAIFDGASASFGAVNPAGAGAGGSSGILIPLGITGPAGSSAGAGSDLITRPFTPSSNTADTVTFTVYKTFPITLPGGAVSTLKKYLPLFDVTIDYETIDLHFEYVARTKARRPRFLQAEYLRDSATGSIIIDNKNTLLDLLVNRVKSVVLGVTTLADLISIAQGAPGAITEDQWRPWVRYVGTGARFEQTPAGQYWHVLETCQIKLDPILPGTADIVATPPV